MPAARAICVVVTVSQSARNGMAACTMISRSCSGLIPAPGFRSSVMPQQVRKSVNVLRWNIDQWRGSEIIWWLSRDDALVGVAPGLSDRHLTSET